MRKNLREIKDYKKKSKDRKMLCYWLNSKIRIWNKRHFKTIKNT